MSIYYYLTVSYYNVPNTELKRLCYLVSNQQYATGLLEVDFEISHIT